MYKALINFNDNVNGGKYNQGDIYPHYGIFPSEERIEYLLTNKNKTKKPVIEIIIEKEKQIKPKTVKRNKKLQQSN